MQKAKRVVEFNLPAQIGFFVFNYAKLQMLKFYYDCIDKFVARQDYCYAAMDTDSAYLGLSASCLRKVIRPEKLQEFYQEYDQWFVSEACSAHKNDFIATSVRGDAWVALCDECIESKKYHTRTPGLFKVEFEGTSIVSLCSKTYYCSGEKDKLSCKGVIKCQNNLTKQHYLDVLYSTTPKLCTNRGFRLKNAGTCTYTQEKCGLESFYIKRKVLDDFVSTEPIDL